MATDLMKFFSLILYCMCLCDIVESGEKAMEDLLVLAV